MSKIQIDLHEDSDGSFCFYLPTPLVPHFKQMVTRAMMTWQDPHPEIRSFADSLSGLDKLLPKTVQAGCPVTSKEK